MKHIKLFEQFLNESSADVDNILLKDIKTLTVKELKDNQEKYMKALVGLLNEVGAESRYDAAKKVAAATLNKFFKTDYGVDLLAFDGKDTDPAWKGVIKVKAASNDYDIPMYSFLGTILTATIGSKKGQEPYKPYVADAVAGKSHAIDQEQKWDENYAVLTGEGGDRSQQFVNAIGLEFAGMTPQPKEVKKN